MINGLIRCKRCVLPETHETIEFDDDGVCNICRQHEHKSEIDWSGRGKLLDNIIEQNRDKYSYDCIVPFSGGKDSTWTVYYLVKKYGINPLVVRFDHGFLRPVVLENTIRTMRRLGADMLNFTPDWTVVRKLMLKSFTETGDFCWHCHSGVVSYPMHMAVKFNVPLVIWGESPAEYTVHRSFDEISVVDETNYNQIANIGITAYEMFKKFDGQIKARSFMPYEFPSLEKLEGIGCQSIHLGSFIPWDVKRQTAAIKDVLAWQEDAVEGVPPEYGYEKIECQLQGVRDYAKFIKRGYARTTHLTSIDIRNGRLSRDKALELVDVYEGERPNSLDLFLEFTGLTEHEFEDIAMSHSVEPYRHDIGYKQAVQ